MGAFMGDKIERINSYTDERFDPEILKQHGAFVVNGSSLCEFRITGRNCAVVNWNGMIDLDKVIQEFRFYAEHICKFYDIKGQLLCEYPEAALIQIPLMQIQPSQFYVDSDKLRAVEEFIRTPEDIILPVNAFGERVMSMDGHTRLYLAVKRKFSYVNCFYTEENKVILEFAQEAQKRGIFTPEDMRLLPHEEYQVQWVGFCEQFFAQRNT